MGKISVHNMNNEPVSELEMGTFWDEEVKSYLLHDMVRYQLAGRRQVTAVNRNRSAVRGGGKKPYKQKGTGNARQGCVRAPHYVGGGRAFASNGEERYSFKLNKKVRKSALKNALAFKYQQGQVLVFDKLEMEKVSTKEFAGFLKKVNVCSALIVLSSDSFNLALSARNIPYMKVVPSEGVNVYDVLKYKNIIMAEQAVSQLEGALAQ